MIDRLPPDLLRSFVAVARTKSFSRAAERVHLSQSTIADRSVALRAIEPKVTALVYLAARTRCWGGRNILARHAH